VHRNVIGNPTAKETISKTKRLWKYNIKIDLKEAGIWIYQVEDRDDWLSVVNAVLKFSGSVQGREFILSLNSCYVEKDSCSMDIVNWFPTWIMPTHQVD
jgi:hypothetical protein